MRYPKIGEQVRVKGETGLHTITVAFAKQWRTTRIVELVLDDGRSVRPDQVVTRYQKTIELFVTQVNYGDGWEDVTQDETRSEARQSLKDYRLNDPHPSRQITRREPNELHQGDQS